MRFVEERRDLAAALRWAARYDLHEGICNHFSLEVDDDLYLINPWEVHWSQMCASDVLLINGDGDIIEGERTVEDTAFFIHRAIHREAPHAKTVLHTHMPFATAIICTEGGRLEMVSQNALRFAGRIAYDDDYNGLGDHSDEGERMASKIGNHSALMLANHGVICTGLTVGAAFDDLYYLEKAAKVQVLAAMTGKPLKIVSEDIVEKTRQAIAGQQEEYAESHWKVLRGILDREEPHYLE